MPAFCKTGVAAVFTVLFALQDPKPPAKPAGPAPDVMPFARVRTEAALDLIGASEIAATDEALWVTRAASGTVTRVDPKVNTAGPTIAIGPGACGGLTSGEASVWLALCGAASLARLDPAKNELAASHPARLTEGGGAIAFGLSSLWVLRDAKGTLLRIDPATGAAVAEIYLPAGASAIAFDSDAIWAADTEHHTVVKVDARSNLIKESIKVGKSPRRIAAGEGAVWVLNHGDGTVSRIDPKSNRVSATIDVGMPSAAGYLAAGEGSVWVSAKGAPLTRIETRGNRVAQQFTGDEIGGPIVIAHKALWMIPRADVVWRIDPRFVEALRPQGQRKP